MSTRSILRFALVIAAAGLGTLGPALGRQAAPTPAPNPATTNAPAVFVRIQNATYTPNAIAVRIGQSIEFENEDQTGHTVTASDGSFDSGFLAKGGTFRTSFAQAGVVRFFDIYHPSMHGTITVIVN